MELTNWKTIYKKQSFGEKSFGVEIRVAIDRPFNDKDDLAMDKIAEDIESAIMGETLRLDPEAQMQRQAEQAELLACFPLSEKVFAEACSNGYCSRWCCTMKPWYVVTTKKGRITVGWRKRVINISWDPSVGGTAESEFSTEDVTKFDRTIHAWGYEKAKQYIARLLL